MTSDQEQLVDAVPAPEQYIGHLLRRVQQVHLAAWTRDVSIEVTSVQFAAMSVLARNPGASQAALGKALDLDRSTIADMVRRMAARELLTRTRSTDDSRRYVLHLTTRGRRLLDDLRPRVEGLEPVLTAGLDTMEAAQLRRFLRAVLASAAAVGLLAGATPDTPD
ncbi:MarR family transcriptional regulator [Rhodococcus sp. IEGM 1379]|uniref:MarR family winged helix-turn-helix transcriptional regulator n=1 Tax=Rhodococcus sp. IEGM 1379 TaxID=3047086 RepID=UPI0024B86469|nr:MarR family transcriptional regulator [Rhodococcus sp. IEGM 1379]MDI9916840.1 MarR family transcriptional regulator [Rhodococcus sp. IEGM 1379]